MEPSPTSPVVNTPSPRQTELQAAAKAVEVAFLTEMLKASGVAEPRASFGGGAGEEQFASLLRSAYAEEIAANGGFGLADAIYRQLQERADV